MGVIWILKIIIVELKNNIIFTIIENQLQYFFQQLDLSKRVYKEIKSDFFNGNLSQLQDSL